LNLDSAIGHEKGVQVIGVHIKPEKLVVTLLVMRIFSGLLGASRTCAYLRDSTAEFRLKLTVVISDIYRLKSKQLLSIYVNIIDNHYQLYSLNGALL